MGSTSWNIGTNASCKDIKKEIEDELGEDFVISAMRFGCSFAVYKGTRHPEFKNLIACVVWSYNKNNGKLTTKVLDETEGPFYYACPLKLVNAPCQKENKEWRDEVRKYWADKNEKRQATKKLEYLRKLK